MILLSEMQEAIRIAERAEVGLAPSNLSSSDVNERALIIPQGMRFTIDDLKPVLNAFNRIQLRMVFKAI